MQRLLLLALALIMAVPAAAQDAGWTRVGQEAWPYRPSVGDIVRTAEGALLACPSGDGLYRSTDGGSLWAPVGLALDLPGCGLVAAADGTLFAGTEEGIYRSDDDGLTWSLAGLERWIYDLASGPDGRLWAIAFQTVGIYNIALFYSDDGAEWVRVADENTIGARFVGGLRHVSISPDGAVFLSAQYGLFRSTDDGVTWAESEIDLDQPGVFPASGVDFVSEMVFVGARTFYGEGLGLYRSTDNGVTWSATMIPDVYVDTVVDTGGGTLLAGTDDGLYDSANGMEWEPAGLNEPVHRVAAILLGVSGEPAFLGTSGGIYRAAGAEWERTNEGFTRGLTMDAVAESGGALYASANGELYRYDITERLWRLPENGGLPTAGRASTLLVHGDALLLGKGSGLYRSEDDGATWEALWLAEGEEERFTTLTITSSGTFVLGTVYSSFSAQIGQLFTSSDEGATWTVMEGWDDSVGGIPYTIVETPTGTLLVAAIAGKFNPTKVYRSTNGGTSWSERGGDGVSSLAVTSGGTIAGVGGGGHYRSVDDGLTWEQVVSGGGGGIIAAPNGGLALIRGSSRDIYYSVDQGLAWTQVSAGLTANVLTADAESFIYAGTAGQGVFRSPAPLFVSSEDGAEALRSLALAPGYPNPAIASTRVPFSLSEAGPVLITVHDVLGRRVATLVEGVLPAGEHAAVWETGAVASGVYVVTLRTGAMAATQRVTVAR
jgi:hypothetical protein